MNGIAKIILRAGWSLAALFAADRAVAQSVATADGVVNGAPGAVPGYAVFRGIPYAAPPVGARRWQPPQPIVPWSGSRTADHFAPDCWPGRSTPDTTTGLPPSEDCLYLNVWTPQMALVTGPRAKLPVMMWIYGGGFTGGSASAPRYDGTGLNRKGVILVSFSYRTSVFGFLAHPALSGESAHHVSGNYGLLDAIAALRWIRRNIAAFGGDPHNVTIFGQSSGSETVNALTLSPLAKGLFAKAIGESGGGFGQREPLPLATAETNGAAYAASFGSDLAALRRASPEQLVAAIGSRHFEPVVDGWFLPADAHTLYARGKPSSVPLLLGSNGDEGQIAPQLTRQAYIAQLRDRFGAHADDVLNLFPAADDDQARASSKALTTMLLGDFNTANWADGAARAGTSPVWQYRFVHAPPPGTPGTMGAHQAGAFHGAEIVYAFNNLNTQDRAWTEADRALETDLSGYWSNFARTGDPNGPGLPRWDRLDPAHPQVLVIADTLTTAPRPNVATIAKLNTIYYGPDGIYPAANQGR